MEHSWDQSLLPWLLLQAKVTRWPIDFKGTERRGLGPGDQLVGSEISLVTMDLLSALPPESPGKHLASGLKPFLVFIPLAKAATSVSSKPRLDPGCWSLSYGLSDYLLPKGSDMQISS